MPVAYDNQRLIDGPGEMVVKGDGLNSNTHGATACTTTVLTMATSPIAAGYRAGDVIKVTATGTQARKIASLTATTITLETALTAAPSTGVAIIRVGVHAGYTDGGITLNSKTNFQERMADQSLDPISVKSDKRESTIKANLLEVFGKNIELAFGLDPSAVTVVGSVTKIAVGNSTLTLTAFGVLLLGSQENGNKVTVFASKVVNQGEASLTFAKDKASTLPLDLKLINDSSRPVGEELYVMEIGPSHNFDYLL